MSTINNTTDTTALASLASQLFQNVDADKNGQLSGREFQSFLESLLNKVGSGDGGSGVNSLSTLASANENRTYQGMLGFDYVKLNTPSHTTAKYVFGRATQDLEFPWDRPSRSEGLQRIADYAKERGYPDAKVIGDDKIDFGDGFGDIDVLTGDGQWWWGPK